MGKEALVKAQQEAERLIERFQNELSGVLYSPHNNVSARQCAIICVEEKIKVQEDFYGLVLTSKFRDRVRQRVELLQSVLNILKEK